MNADPKASVPSTMKAILIRELYHQSIDDVISMTNSKALPKREKGQLLLRVLTCAMAPGDVRVHKGQCDYFQKPKEIPYVPGGDVCGVVVEKDHDDARFDIGDVVAGMFTLPGPHGGLAEYATVLSHNAWKIPEGSHTLSPVEMACLTSSALCALTAVEQYVHKGDRVLVLGGAGGVGTAFLQMAKHVGGASYLATTTTQHDLIHSLGSVDRVIDYRTEQWWQLPEFTGNDKKFDLIFDLVGGTDSAGVNNFTKSKRVIQPKGMFLAAAGDNAFPELHGVWDVLGLIWNLLKRAIYVKFCPRAPCNYTFINALDLSKRVMYVKTHPWSTSSNYEFVVKDNPWERLAKLVQDGALRVIVDETFDFTVEDVKKAFHRQASRHVHGKLVVKIADE